MTTLVFLAICAGWLIAWVWFLWLAYHAEPLTDADRRREADAWRAKVADFADKHYTDEYPAVDADDAECVS